MISRAQQDMIELQKELTKRGLRFGERSFHWISRTAPDGERYREYYASRSERNRRLHELLDTTPKLKRQ